MKVLLGIIVWVLLFPGISEGGVIFGKISKSGKSIGANVKVEIVHIKTNKTYITKTNKFGAFRLFIPETGKCRLTIPGKKQSPSISVNSFRSANECNLVIYRDKTGKYRLRRK